MKKFTLTAISTTLVFSPSSVFAQEMQEDNSVAAQKLNNALKEYESLGLTLETDIQPATGPEDFVSLSTEVPGNYFTIGNGDDCSVLHTSTKFL